MTQPARQSPAQSPAQSAKLSAGTDPPTSIPAILCYVKRDRGRAAVRASFPRRRCRVLSVRTPEDCENGLKGSLIDAVIVDLGAADESTWRVAAMARDYPSAPFYGLTSLRVADGTVLAAAASHGFADVLVEGVDDSVARHSVLRDCFGSRFARALAVPPSEFALDTPIQLAAWRYIVGNAARPVRTSALAADLGVTREHLSRVFSANGSPNLKRVIDLVRLLVAAELAKNPGYDMRDVARILQFASPSHLSATAQRVSGAKPASLSRLRAVDLIGRFLKGHGRSRG